MIKKNPNKKKEPTYVAKQNYSNLKISIGPGKISKKIINVGSMSIPESKVLILFTSPFRIL